ncbi:MAG: tetratricopeptide repeat protein [Pseudobdellovibrio sp.]
MKTAKLFLILYSIFILNIAQAITLNGLVKNQGETFNFEISGQKNWDYDLSRIKEKNQTKVQLLIKSISEDSINKIKNIDNPYVQAISVQQRLSDKKWLIEFTLKNDDVETFDYLTDQPSKLIVDFYLNTNEKSDLVTKDEPTVKPSKAVVNSKKAPKKAVVLKNDESEVVKDRKPAEADYLILEHPGGIETSPLLKSGLNDGADAFLQRFVVKDIEINERSILKSDNNYYLKFPMLETNFSFWEKMKTSPPVYQFQNGKTDENKQVRLIQKLFEKKRFQVFKKTVEWFENKYPKSEYLESIAFMKADSLLELWKLEKKDQYYEQAQFAYLQALDKYPKSALAERTSLMLGLLSVDKSDYMTAIRRFNNHIENQNFKNRISNEYAQLGLSFSLSKIKKLNDAVAVMDKLEKESKNPLVQAEAAFRRADFYFEDKKYAEAIENYKMALAKYSSLQHLFPNANFNQMEAYFWSKKFKDAHQSGLDFVTQFHSHPLAPYALTRVAELLEILGAEQSKAVGAYLETYFRYGDNPKTIVARLHLLSTRMKSMKDEEVKQTIAKMDELSKKSDLVNVDQFKTVMIADGYTRHGDHEKSIEILSDFYKQNPNRPDSRQVTRRIIGNIFDQIKNSADAGKFKDVMQTYQKYSDTWLNHQDRIDTDYYLGIAYDKAGDYEVALQKYLKTQKNMNSIKGTEKEKWVAATENLPTEDNLSLHIADTNFQLKNYQQAYQSLEKIKEPHLLSEPDQILRIQMASSLYEQKGDMDTSMRYLSELVRVWNGKPELSIGVMLRLAEMQNKKNNTEAAQGTLEKIVEIAEKNNKVNIREVIKAANLSADLYKQENKIDDAIKKYSFILDKYESDNILSEERYKLGELLFKKGELKKAETVWAQLKGKGSEFWAKISANKLKQSQWKDDYKKYLKRIPAMSKIEEQQ